MNQKSQLIGHLTIMNPESAPNLIQSHNISSFLSTLFVNLLSNLPYKVEPTHFSMHSKKNFTQSLFKMQAALNLAPTFLPLQTPTKSFKSLPKSIPAKQTCLFAPIRAAAVANDTSTVDYSSTTSVFPAEACETLGGEACDVEMYPEVKPKPGSMTNKKLQTASEQVEREYLEYNSPKTVFPGDACDELGGEFCQPEYQSGVY